MNTSTFWLCVWLPWAIYPCACLWLIVYSYHLYNSWRHNLWFKWKQIVNPTTKNTTFDFCNIQTHSIHNFLIYYNAFWEWLSPQVKHPHIMTSVWLRFNLFPRSLSKFEFPFSVNSHANKSFKFSLSSTNTKLRQCGLSSLKLHKGKWELCKWRGLIWVIINYLSLFSVFGVMWGISLCN